MPIYTRTGDKGTTAVFGGKRLLKSDKQIEAYGSLDELTSFIGLTFAKIKDSREKKLLLSIQKSLYEIMAYLANAKVDLKDLEQEINKFEQEIDIITKKLPKLNRFIIPSGNEIVGLYHVTRSVSRRAEREVVGYFKVAKRDIQNTLRVLQYLNRLSDLFFTLARKNSKGKEHLT